MNFLGIDVGTGGTRALVIDPAGRIVGSATTEHVPFATPRPGWAEQDPRGLVARDRRRGPRRPGRRRDRRRRHRGRGLFRTDARFDAARRTGSGRPAGAALVRPAHRRRVRRDHGDGRRRPPDRADARTRRSPASPCPSCCGCGATSPSSGRASARCSSPRTTSASASPASAPPTSPTPRARCSSTSPTGAGRPRSPARSTSIWRCCRAPSSRPRSPARVNAAGAAATGLRAGTPVVAGGGDQAAGAVGMGIVEAGLVSATIGTSGVVFAATSKPALDPKGRVHTFCHAVPGMWHVMGVTQGAGPVAALAARHDGRRARPTISSARRRPACRPAATAPAGRRT